uniref:FH2 domain-containing protein n=1 Tax=Caenorhabditis japonica TaxID=281687 RepID=A0A8R1I3Z5_CAEJA
MLKQFKNVDEFIENVAANKPVAESDALQNLFGMLPQADEEEALKRYIGDISLLSPPSAFFYRLVAIPFYRLRIETLIFLTDFSRLMQELAPNVEVLISASREILTSPTLPRLLLILVNMGNYLNSNNSQGNAFGFTLNSMWKLIDLKGNKQDFSLLHLLVTCEPDLVLNLQSELSLLKEASQISFDEIKNSLKALKEHRNKLEKQLELRANLPEFSQFLELIKIDCSLELQEFETRYQQLQELQKELAHYFCENRSTFQLDECLKIFTFLLNRLHQTHKEHVSRENRRARKEEKKEREKERLEVEKKAEKRNTERCQEDLFETLNGTSNDSTELTRKRVSDILDVRQKLGSVRVRKINTVVTNPVDSFTPPPPLESPTGSSKENELKSPTEAAKTSTNYDNCNDLESYISSLARKRATNVQKEREREKENVQIAEATVPPVQPIPQIPETIKTPPSSKKSTPEMAQKPTTPRTLKPPSTISRPSGDVRIVSVTTSPANPPRNNDGPSKLAELRKPGVRSPQERKITPPRVITTPVVKAPVSRATPRVTVVAPPKIAGGSLAPPSVNVSRRMSAPVVRKPTMTAEKKREVCSL